METEMLASKQSSRLQEMKKRLKHGASASPLDENVLSDGEPALRPPAGEVIQSIPVAVLQARSNQPRKIFDQVALEELAASIQSEGVMQPIVVRPIEGGRFEIVAGERRWRAVQLAGLETVPVVVRQLDEAQAMRQSLVENLQREDLNPIEEAQAIDLIMSEYALNQKAVSEVLGKSVSYISRSLSLIKYTSEATQHQLAIGDVAANHPDVQAQIKAGKAKDTKTKKAGRKASTDPSMKVPKSLLISLANMVVEQCEGLEPVSGNVSNSDLLAVLKKGVQR